MDDYITKPVKVGGVQAALERWGTESRCRPQAGADSIPVIDWTVLDGLCEMAGDPSDNAMISELIGLYLEDSPARLDAIRVAVKWGNAEDILRAAHSLKGSSANLGAAALAGACFDLEQLAREARLDGTGFLLARVETEYERVTSAYRKLLATTMLQHALSPAS